MESDRAFEQLAPCKRRYAPRDIKIINCLWVYECLRSGQLLPERAGPVDRPSSRCIQDHKRSLCCCALCNWCVTRTRHVCMHMGPL